MERDVGHHESCITSHPSAGAPTSCRSVIDGALDLIYPPKCMACGTLGSSYLCASCMSKIEPVSRPYCPRCGHSMPTFRCRDCWGRVRSFTAARAVGKYEGVLRQAIHALKYGGARMLAQPLAYLLFRYLTDSADFPWRRADCIVPVPIHPARRRIRGYNQSELLAEELLPMIHLPVIADAVFRRLRTRPQVELSGEERRDNVKDAFRVADPAKLSGRIVLLVDDVGTTGSTAHECSLALLKGGASRVYVVCLAFDM